MSRWSHNLTLSLFVLLWMGGCVLGPQPEPPDITGNDDPAAEADADPDGAPGAEPCDPDDDTDEDGDGIPDCHDGMWSGDEDAGGDCDPDADEQPLPPPGYGRERLQPDPPVAQWPYDDDGFNDEADDDGDADLVVIDL